MVSFSEPRTCHANTTYRTAPRQGSNAYALSTRSLQSSALPPSSNYVIIISSHHRGHDEQIELIDVYVQYCNLLNHCIFMISHRRDSEQVLDQSSLTHVTFSFSQGEYTTGWTGSGASTSDKKVCAQPLTSLRMRMWILLHLDRRMSQRSILVSAPRLIAVDYLGGGIDFV